MTDRITPLEESVAHLTRVVDELSEVIARQDREIDRLTRRLALLIEREAERGVSFGGDAPPADRPPPHW